MTDRDWLHLPPEFGGTQDPIDKNPFPEGTTLHRIWVDATKIAEKESLDFQIFLADPKRIAEASTDFQGLFNFWVVPQAVKFDIWAKRGTYVIVTEGLLSSYEQWVRGYANTWLDALANFFERNLPPFRHEPLLVEFRNLLLRRVLHWRSEARRNLEEQIAYRRDLDSPKPVGADVKAHRKVLIAAYKRKHELTAEGFAKKVGVSTTGIRGLVNEDRSRFSEATQSNFLASLGISREAWYSS